MALFLIQEFVICLLFGYAGIRAYQKMRSTKSSLWKELNFGRVMLGLGIILRSAAIFVPISLPFRIIIWQIGEILFIGAWHFMFNHDFREFEEFLESRRGSPLLKHDDLPIPEDDA